MIDLSSSVLRLLCMAALTILLVSSPVASALAQETPDWSLEEYERLFGDIQAADDDLTLTAPGTESWRDANLAALEARRSLVAFVSNALRTDTVPDDYIEPVTQARFVLIQNIISINADLGYCEQAEAALVLLREVSDRSSAVREAFEAAREDVSSCVPYEPPVAVTAQPETPAPTPVAQANPDPAPTPQQTAPSTPPATAVDPMADPGAPGSGRRTVGIALLATGGAMLVGGLGWDIASAQGPRSEFTELSDTCDGSADCVARLNELSDTIDSSRAPIGALTIGGAAIAVTGTVLWLTAPRERDAQRVSFMPEWRPGYMGASLSFR